MSYKIWIVTLLFFGSLIATHSSLARQNLGGPIDGTWKLRASTLSDASNVTMRIDGDKAYLTYLLTLLETSYEINEEWQIAYLADNLLGITPINIHADSDCPIEVGLTEEEKVEIVVPYKLDEFQNKLELRRMNSKELYALE